MDKYKLNKYTYYYCQAAFDSRNVKIPPGLPPRQ